MASTESAKPADTASAGVEQHQHQDGGAQATQRPVPAVGAERRPARSSPSPRRAARSARCGRSGRTRRSRARPPGAATGPAPGTSGPARAGTRRPGSGWCPTRRAGGSARSPGSRPGVLRRPPRRRRPPGPGPAPAGRPAGAPPSRGGPAAPPRPPATTVRAPRPARRHRRRGAGRRGRGRRPAPAGREAARSPPGGPASRRRRGPGPAPPARPSGPARRPRGRASRHETWSAPARSEGPVTVCGSEATVPTTVTAAPSSARSATGLCATRSARSAATAPAATASEHEPGHRGRERRPAAADQPGCGDRDPQRGSGHGDQAATAGESARHRAHPGRAAEQRHPEVGPRRMSGAWGVIVAHTVTKGATLSRVTSPMPSTSRSSSTDVNPPCSSRQARIEAAVTGPTSGRLSSSVSVAVLRLTRVGGPGRHSVRRGSRGGAGGRRHAHDHLLAVDEDPGQVEPGQVDAGPRPAGRLECVDHPGPLVEHGDAGAAHLARHVDGDGAGCRGRPTAAPARAWPAAGPRRTRAPPTCAGAAASSEAGSAPPRTSHQQVTASPTATTTATTASWAGPRASRSSTAAGAPGPSCRVPARGRHHAGQRPRCRASAAAGAEAPRAGCARPTTATPTARQGGGSGRAGRTPGELVTEQREPAGDGGLLLGARVVVRACDEPRKIRRPPSGPTALPVDNPAGAPTCGRLVAG